MHILGQNLIVRLSACMLGSAPHSTTECSCSLHLRAVLPRPVKWPGSAYTDPHIKMGLQRREGTSCTYHSREGSSCTYHSREGTSRTYHSREGTSCTYRSREGTSCTYHTISTMVSGQARHRQPSRSNQYWVTIRYLHYSYTHN